MSSTQAARAYRPRQAQQTVVHQVVKEYLPELIEQAEEGSYSLPALGLAWDVCKQTMQLLQKLGRSLDVDPADGDTLAQESPLLAACYAASLQGSVALGARAGQRVLRLGDFVARTDSCSIETQQTLGHGGGASDSRDSKRARSTRIAWGDLAARTFSIDVLEYFRCGHRPIRVVGVIGTPSPEQLAVASAATPRRRGHRQRVRCNCRLRARQPDVSGPACFHPPTFFVVQSHRKVI